MENKFEKGPEINKVRIEDKTLFGDLLRRLRVNSVSSKNIGQIAHELGISPNTLKRWEEGTVFPDQSKLPNIALVYENMLSDLPSEYESRLAEINRTFVISKEAREIEKDVRKDLKFVPKQVGPDTEVYHGTGRIFRHKPSRQSGQE